MGDPLKLSKAVDVGRWLEEMAKEQLQKELNELQSRMKRLSDMSYIEYVRQHGLSDVCPHTAPQVVRDWLGLSRMDNDHFRVSADSGNEGRRLEVGQSNREWDNVEDPWAAAEEECVTGRAP